jgi:4-amino-4-deoxy-L-arabinose transferase-like glycosyltransferase
MPAAVGRASLLRRDLWSRERLLGDTALLVYLGLIGFAAHMLVAGNYGYFRDELYYIMAGRHLAPGYVDFPPAIALLAALMDALSGDNLVAIHVIPALAFACLVVVTGLMARELGGGRFAQLLAALGSLVSVVFMATGSIFSMDALDTLWWALGAYVVIRIIRRNEPRLWLLLGLVAGIGLLTKLTMLFFGFSLVMGLLLTPTRAVFRTRWPWLGGAIAFSFLLPYLLWNAANGWPTLMFWHNSGRGSGGIIGFLVNQIFTINPFTLPLWLAGLTFYFRAPAGKPYRALGWTYVVLYVLLMLLDGKPYYLSPAYPMLFAGGALIMEGVVRQRRWAWVRPAYPAALALSGLLLAPLAMPVLPPATFAQDYGWLSGLANSGAGQRGQVALPQYLADRFGWDSMTRTVARVYDALPPAERAQACIFTQNYGEASALNFLGPAYHLPPAVSGHNSYFIWGPGACSGEVIISVNLSRDDLAKTYADISQAAMITCKYCWPQENDLPVYVARHPKVPVRAAWATVKHFN